MKRYAWWECAGLRQEVENDAQIRDRVVSGDGRNMLRIAVSECYKN